MRRFGQCGSGGRRDLFLGCLRGFLLGAGEGGFSEDDELVCSGLLGRGVLWQDHRRGVVSKSSGF